VIQRSAGSAVEEAEHGSRASEHKPPGRGRVGIVLVMILALLVSAVTRYWADEKRQAAIPNRGESGAGTSLSGMNSFALGLLLGGLRGPLVMILWTSSEAQKSQKNLEGIDTQIEWIRLLQPEFDTVHLFQIWNKAYNISVQMASLSNKYSVILDALEYAKSVDREKPEDVNILSAMAQLYFDKLGTSNEHVYYKKRIRQETLPHGSASQLRRQDPGWRPMYMNAMLDAHFNLLPSLITPLPGRQPPADPRQEYVDGSDLQFLVPYQPFPDGLSPFALAYNYDKRSEVLLNAGKQHHAQLSDLVIDSRPALALKNWAEDEWEQGRRRELEAFGLPEPDDRSVMEPITADFAPDHPIIDRHAAELAVFEYNRSGLLVRNAIEEYLRHLSNDDTNEGNYRSHMDELAADAQLTAGDRDYLAAQLAAPAARAPLLNSAAQHYIESIYLYEIVILKYNTDVQYLTSALPPGFARYRTTDRRGIEDLSPQQIDAVMNTVMRARGTARDSHSDDQTDYIAHIARAVTQRRHIASRKKEKKKEKEKGSGAPTPSPNKCALCVLCVLCVLWIQFHLNKETTEATEGTENTEKKIDELFVLGKRP
jgi:hypothetical protein